jgi:hypothetical protein
MDLDRVRAKVAQLQQHPQRECLLTQFIQDRYLVPILRKLLEIRVPLWKVWSNSKIKRLQKEAEYLLFQSNLNSKRCTLKNLRDSVSILKRQIKELLDDPTQPLHLYVQATKQLYNNQLANLSKLLHHDNLLTLPRPKLPESLLKSVSNSLETGAPRLCKDQMNKRLCYSIVGPNKRERCEWEHDKCRPRTHAHGLFDETINIGDDCEGFSQSDCSGECEWTATGCQTRGAVSPEAFSGDFRQILHPLSRHAK